MLVDNILGQGWPIWAFLGVFFGDLWNSSTERHTIGTMPEGQHKLPYEQHQYVDPQKQNSAVEMRTTLVTDTTTVTETAVPEFGGVTGCDWAMLRTLTIPLENPFNVVTEGEIAAWEHIASEAHKMHDELKDMAKLYPRKAEAYGDVLKHLVDEPLQNACEILLDTRRQLLHNTKLEFRNSISDLAHLITDATSRLAMENRFTRQAPRTGRLDEKASLALFRVIGNYHSFCLVSWQCSWDQRIFDIWQLTELKLEQLTVRFLEVKSQLLSRGIKETELKLEELTTRLLEAKSQLLSSEKKEAENESKNGWNIQRALLWTVVVYFVLVFMARLLSMGYLFGERL
ncbi:hypothetical protein HD806DRAFT_547347 [Xylariaceae sp. AK1471]|nr:hypothetical protein HD806DRAFT_547347 [Xylariaceae sp. AK1471]